MSARDALATAAAAALLIAAVAVPAGAQDRVERLDPVERPDMPAANARVGPDPAPDLTASSGQQFSAWSRSRGRPRIMLFWNTALTDETSTRTRTVARSRSLTAARRGMVASVGETTVEDERIDGGLDREDEAALEDAFVASFVQADANLVDRAALMRKASTRQGAVDRADQQFMEALALEQGIDYLIEVLPEYAAATDTGLNFSVRVLHVPSSRVVSRFRSDGRPTPGAERLVARAGGFRRERDEFLTPTHIGTKLAAQTMQTFR
jgi:hypothetical protein